MAVERRKGVYVPDGPNNRHEPMVGPGVSVWAIVGYLKFYDWDVSRIQQAYDPYLTEDDVRAAWDYYKRHTVEIDEKLRRNEMPDLDPAEWGLE
jgi:uncharacterized protein (DUF433 family)